MSQSVGAAASAQAFEVLGAVMAKKQMNQEAQMTTMLLDSAMKTGEQLQTAQAVGSLGQNINISV